jgi:transmembrane sensor
MLDRLSRVQAVERKPRRAPSPWSTMQEQRQDPLIEEALRWFVVLRDKAASDADRQAFDLWRRSNPRHEDAWARAQQVWMRVGKFGPAFANRRPPANAQSLSRLAAAPSLRPVLSRPATHPMMAGRRRFLYAAAAAAVVAVPAGMMLLQPGLFADHGTAVGERRTISLADGSTVELAGASSVSVDFAADARRVVLHDGEAFFNVRRDAARPFIVEAAAGRTQALGTAFDVKRQGDDVTVAVAEHSVAVSTAGGRVVVEQGQQVRYGQRRLGAVGAADLGRVEAWRRDQLVFHEAPLGEVIADLERYRGGRIVVTDSRLREIPVTAVFDALQAEAALDTIASSLPIRMRRVTGLLVVLSPKA